VYPHTPIYDVQYENHLGLIYCAVRPPESEEECEVTRPEWERRRENFTQLVQNIKVAFNRLCQAANRELVYNLYTYLWDMVGVALLLHSYIHWMALGQFSPKYKQLIIGRHTWFSGKM
jgi:protein O-GlcNAcase/histone acetyltransferase